MFERFLALTAAVPDAVALIEGESGRIVSRAQLLERADAIASQLASAGLRAGDRVAVQLPNSPDFVAVFLAVLRLKLVAILIDRDAPERDVARILSHFGARGLVYGGISIAVREVGRLKSAAPLGAALIK